LGGVIFVLVYARRSETVTLILTKRQKQILSFIEESVRTHGYAPSLHEIRGHFKLHSIATVHKHLVHLEEKGLIKRHRNRARAIEVIAFERRPEARELPLQGFLSAGGPVEAIREKMLVAVPEDMIRERDVYLLRARGEWMADEQIRDGDYVLVERRTDPENGEVVLALLDGAKVVLKRFYREKDQIRLAADSQKAPSLRVPEDGVVIQGVVVGLLRKY
jgi:repressor LexA